MVVALAGLAISGCQTLTANEPQSAQGAVLAAVESELSQPVGIAPDFVQTAAPWQLLCGTVTAPDGGTFTPTTVLAETLLAESRDFCALLDISNGAQVLELDIGSTDMPAIDWLEAYDLPPELLQGG